MMMKTEKKDKSRREFLKKVATVVVGTAAASVIKPFNAIVYATAPKKDSEHWYGMGIDLDKCIGCGRCADACKQENGVPREPFFFRTWVEQYTIKENGEVVVESPNGGIDGFKQSVPDNEIFKSFFVPKMCNHCAHSPCVQVFIPKGTLSINARSVITA
ncbi:MAG: 4Fe-4S dicluster domain-containing protein [Deltaproteobacteria bacterium]|nr:4Fe-4S dicluster domain-containing protein [Deltaproteobacteria bacterium]